MRLGFGRGFGRTLAVIERMCWRRGFVRTRRRLGEAFVRGSWRRGSREEQMPGPSRGTASGGCTRDGGAHVFREAGGGAPRDDHFLPTLLRLKPVGNRAATGRWSARRCSSCCTTRRPRTASNSLGSPMHSAPTGRPLSWLDSGSEAYLDGSASPSLSSHSPSPCPPGNTGPVEFMRCVEHRADRGRRRRSRYRSSDLL